MIEIILFFVLIFCVYLYRCICEIWDNEMLMSDVIAQLNAKLKALESENNGMGDHS